MLGRWYKKYTPQECARLCSKISNFYGSSCTHFSRQWITSRVPEHSDTCGRDGEVLPANMPAHGAWGSAGVGTGTYTYRGQCVFFNSPNNHCCSTKVEWRTSASSNDDNFCTARYGDRKDNWDSKHRSWRKSAGDFTPSEAWPVASAGRRLGEDAHVTHDANKTHIHELFLPNGTRFWAFEDEFEVPTYDEVVLNAAEEEGEEGDEGEEEEGEQRRLQEEDNSVWGYVEAAWEKLWR